MDKKQELSEKYDGPWVSVPWQVMALYPIMGKTGVYLWLYLHARQNSKRQSPECWPSYERIKNETGLSSSTIKKTIDRLVKLGLLEYRAGNWQDREQNRYTTCWPSEEKVTRLIEEHKKHGYVMGSKLLSLHTALPSTPNRFTHESESLSEEHRIALPSKVELEEGTNLINIDESNIDKHIDPKNLRIDMDKDSTPVEDNIPLRSTPLSAIVRASAHMG